MSSTDVNVFGHRMSVEDAHTWYGSKLPTVQRADGVNLVTQESLHKSLFEKFNIPLENMTASNAPQVFEYVIELLQTMLKREQVGELEYVSPVTDKEQTLPGGYRLVYKSRE